MLRAKGVAVAARSRLTRRAPYAAEQAKAAIGPAALGAYGPTSAEPPQQALPANRVRRWGKPPAEHRRGNRDGDHPGAGLW